MVAIRRGDTEGRVETEVAQPVGKALAVGHGLDAVLREPSVIGDAEIGKRFVRVVRPLAHAASYTTMRQLSPHILVTMGTQAGQRSE